MSPAASGFSVPIFSNAAALLGVPAADTLACDGATAASAIPVSASADSVFFIMCTRTVTTRTVATLTAGTTSKTSRQVTIIPRATIVLSDSDVVGGAVGQQYTGTVTLQSTPTRDVTVILQASDPSVNFLGSNTGSSLIFTVPAGQRSAGFQLHVTTVPSGRSVTVQVLGDINVVWATTAMMVRAPVVTSIALQAGNPSQIVGGTSPNAVVTLDVPAPAGGRSVQLSSDQASVTVPSVVTVLQGSTQAIFAIGTQAGTRDVTATITARTGTVARTLSIRVLATPP